MKVNDLLVDDKKTNVLVAQAIYVMLIVGIAISLLAIIGVVTAIIYKKSAPEWLQSHYRFQVRTFCIGTLLMLLGIVSMFMMVGYFVLLLSVIWIIVRCIKGLILVSKSKPHPNPAGWLF